MKRKLPPIEPPAAKNIWRGIRNELADIRSVIAILLRQPDSQVSERCKNLMRFVIERYDPSAEDRARQLTELKTIAKGRK